jgi:ferredoxin--NADP+ reductase
LVVNHTTLEVLDRRMITADTFVLRTTRPETSIDAGQCFSVGTRELAINREYSMYSAQHDPFVDFLIRRVEGGAVSSTLSSMNPGDPVEIGGPYGSFCLNVDDVRSKRFVFIATGTGIAPFASFVKTFPQLNYLLLHGIRFESETYDSALYDPASYVACVSKPDSGAGVRVTDMLKSMSLDEDDLYYLCGNRMMITDTVQILRDKGIPGGQVYMETFF